MSFLFFIHIIFAQLSEHEQFHLDAIKAEIAENKAKTKEEKDKDAEKQGIKKDKYDKYLDDKEREYKKVDREKKLPEGVDPDDLISLHDYFDEVGR